MSTNGSSATWLSVLEEKKHDIAQAFGKDCKVPLTICDGRSFRSALEKLSSRKGEHKVSRLATKLIPSLTPVAHLARAAGQSISDLQQLAPNEAPEGLIWWISFALIEVSVSEY